MKEIKVIWHKNPDTDCVLSAIIMSIYLKNKWYNAAAYIQGDLNNETKFALEKIWLNTPEIKTSFPSWTTICLTDHNEKSQSLDNIDELNIEYLIDHHKINFSSSNPIYIRTEPLCSTCSITYKMFKEAKIKITAQVADMMITGIISDSLMFRSATTTKEDIKIFEELKEITSIKDIDKYAIDMFNAKSDLWNISIEKLIKYDYKVFNVDNIKMWIWTLETTNPNYALDKKEEILKWLKEIKEKDWLNFIMLSIVDILNKKNTTIILDEDSNILKNVFWVNISNNLADLWSRLSRKKQIVPNLTEYFKK